MLPVSRVIIADTSCFILPDKIDSLKILNDLFGEVSTTLEVSLEFGKHLPGWIKIETVKIPINNHYLKLK